MNDKTHFLKIDTFSLIFGAAIPTINQIMSHFWLLNECYRKTLAKKSIHVLVQKELRDRPCLGLLGGYPYPPGGLDSTSSAQAVAPRHQPCLGLLGGCPRPSAVNWS